MVMASGPSAFRSPHSPPARDLCGGAMSKWPLNAGKTVLGLAGCLQQPISSQSERKRGNNQRLLGPPDGGDLEIDTNHQRSSGQQNSPRE
ncbi:polyketide synthase [Aspergillus luchuensis]|uniref:Polyketide synthase n=1 Tax=Aspergillus kawachii TaxID=1069201 RepID=A0A146FDT5_ASPKA|nr:polyketide synthase [Aspergillus luchuensis]